MPFWTTEALMSATRKLVIVILVSLSILLLYPFKTTLVPEQRVLVVTRDMHPIRNILVRQIWQHYSLEARGHEEDLPTDVNGRITFPTRTIRASLLMRIFGPLRSVLGQGVHASFGIHTDMFTLATTDAKASTEVAQPQPGEIVYRLEL